MGSGQILIRPNELRATAERLRVSASRIELAVRRVDERMNLPGYVLSGYQAGEIRRRYLAKRDRLNAYHVRVQHFANQLEKIADRMEEADRRLIHLNGGREGDFSPDILSILTNIFKGTGHLSKEFLGIISDFVGGRGKFKADLRELGLGDLYKYLSKGIPYRGSMDKFLKSDLFQKGFVVVGTLLDVIEDVQNGTPIPEALGVNIINGVETYAISAAHPYAALALLINAGIQIRGDISTAEQELLVDVIAPDQQMHDLLMSGVNRYSTSIDKMDLENVTKEIGRTVYNVFVADYVDVGQNTATGLWNWATQDGSTSGLIDTIENINSYNNEKLPLSEQLERLCPIYHLINDPRTGEGLQKTWEATTNVFDGILDSKVAESSNVATYTIVGGVNLVNRIPGISEETKALINSAAYQSIQQSNQVIDSFINLWGGQDGY